MTVERVLISTEKEEISDGRAEHHCTAGTRPGTAPPIVLAQTAGRGDWRQDHDVRGHYSRRDKERAPLTSRQRRSGDLRRFSIPDAASGN